MLLRIKNILETVSPWDDEKGADPDTCGMTSGTLGDYQTGKTFTLERFNKDLESIGLNPLTKETLHTGVWNHETEEAGRFDYSFVGLADATPDKAGKFLYDVSLYLEVVETRPLSPELVP